MCFSAVASICAEPRCVSPPGETTGNRAGPIDRAKRPSIFQPPTSILCCASGDASSCPIPAAMARGAIPIVTDALGYGEWLTVRADGSYLQGSREDSLKLWRAHLRRTRSAERWRPRTGNRLSLGLTGARIQPVS